MTSELKHDLGGYWFVGGIMLGAAWLVYYLATHPVASRELAMIFGFLFLAIVVPTTVGAISVWVYREVFGDG